MLRGSLSKTEARYSGVLLLLLGGLFNFGDFELVLAMDQTQTFSAPDSEVPSRPPNVVFILADDLGWSDTTLYGTTRFYRTPNIQRLAERGMTFTRAYASSPLCSPTRASLLTGMSPARHGITAPTCHLPEVVMKPEAPSSAAPNVPAPPLKSVTRLDTRYVTIAEKLRDAGYRTGHFGKWHLGAEPYSPLEHGFDIDLPHWPGPGPAGSYVAPWKFKDFDHDPDVPDQHLEDRMSAEAVRFMEENREKPFFLNYWMFSVHAPFDAKQKLIEDYRPRVDPEGTQRSPTYAAMIESMDDAVGVLLDTLDRLGLSENTLVIFASDNGGNMYNEVDGGPPTSNAPLRGGKATIFEGGIRGPCVVAWPGKVVPKSVSDELIQSADFYPTILEATKVSLSKEQPCDGQSLLPVLLGGTLGDRAIFTYFPHQTRVPDWLPPAVSVHEGDWKLIRLFHAGVNGDHRWKLFHLAKDQGEERDLAALHPDHVRRLDQKIEAFLKETGAVTPLRNTQFDASSYRPELEGIPVASRKSGAARKPGSRDARPDSMFPPVLGWRPDHQVRLEDSGKRLQLASLGKDPHISYALPSHLPAGRYSLQLSMRAESSGNAQWFWQEANRLPIYLKDRSVVFDIRHDGEKHDYRFTFVAESPIVSFRFDPSRGKGTVMIERIELKNDAGSVVMAWPNDTGRKLD